MPYEIYKVLHISFLFLFFALASAGFYQTQPSKKLAMAIGIVGFFVMVFGMGLMARLGIASAWPLWTVLKVVLWLVIMGGAHMIAKKSKSPACVGIPFLFACGLAAAIIAIYKPM